MESTKLQLYTLLIGYVTKHTHTHTHHIHHIPHTITQTLQYTFHTLHTTRTQQTNNSLLLSRQLLHDGYNDVAKNVCSIVGGMADVSAIQPNNELYKFFKQKGTIVAVIMKVMVIVIMIL
jgi:hypothetical protein